MGGRGRKYGCERRKGREEEKTIHVTRPPSKRFEEASKAGLYCLLVQ